MFTYCLLNGGSLIGDQDSCVVLVSVVYTLSGAYMEIYLFC